MKSQASSAQSVRTCVKLVRLPLSRTSSAASLTAWRQRQSALDRSLKQIRCKSYSTTTPQSRARWKLSGATVSLPTTLWHTVRTRQQHKQTSSRPLLQTQTTPRTLCVAPTRTFSASFWNLQPAATAPTASSAKPLQTSSVQSKLCRRQAISVSWLTSSVTSMPQCRQAPSTTRHAPSRVFMRNPSPCKNVAPTATNLTACSKQTRYSPKARVLSRMSSLRHVSVTSRQPKLVCKPTRQLLMPTSHSPVFLIRNTKRRLCITLQTHASVPKTAKL